MGMKSIISVMILRIRTDLHRPKKPPSNLLTHPNMANFSVLVTIPAINLKNRFVATKIAIKLMIFNIDTGTDTGRSDGKYFCKKAVTMLRYEMANR
jgi:hypothetical protein